MSDKTDYTACYKKAKWLDSFWPHYIRIFCFFFLQPLDDLDIQVIICIILHVCIFLIKSLCVFKTLQEYLNETEEYKSALQILTMAEPNVSLTVIFRI